MTWDEYKDHVKATDPETRKELEAIEALSKILSPMIAQRNALGLTQRELAQMCGIPQSSIARIEACKTTPNLATLLKIFAHLGLSLTVTRTASA